MPPPRRGWVVAALVAAAAALLPFARPLLAGESLYFRDLGLIFFPLRRLALDGLAGGFVTWWNPYVHEGAPLPIPALSYPFDLLQLLAPTEAGLSASLILHLPLAALAFLALARSLGLSPAAAAGGAIVYTLGGFGLSTINLYIYVQALAWAPVVVLTLGRATAIGRARDVGFGALTTALVISTTAAEVALQAMALGVAFGLHVGFRTPVVRLPRCWPEAEPSSDSLVRGLLRAGVALALAAMLAAPILATFRAQLEGTERGAGFATEVVLAHSIHPLSWLQALIAGFYFDPYDVANHYWGQNFFSRGFPYFLSLYLGPLAVGLAAGALMVRGDAWPEAWRGLRRRLAIVLPLAAIGALGSYVGLTPLVDALPPLHSFRYPQKLYFTIHFGASLLAALGLEALGRGARRPLAAVAALGAALAALPLLPLVAPATADWFARGFFPTGLGAQGMAESQQFQLADAATGGGLALLAAAAGLALRAGGRTALAAALLPALLAADLLRAGAGLNASVTPAFFRLSPEATSLASALRTGGQRVFTCDVHGSAAYRGFRRQHRGRHELATFALLRESLTPNYNVDARVRTALSMDLTMMVPAQRVTSPREALCGQLDELVPRLREAGVGHVLSLDALDNTALAGVARVALPALPGLTLDVYRVEPPPLPLTEVEGGRLQALDERPGRLLARVEAPAAARLVVRQAWARGWRATVDGRGVEVGLHAGRHLAVAVPAGVHEVGLEYQPPGLPAAAGLAALAALAVGALLTRRPDAC